MKKSINICSEIYKKIDIIPDSTEVVFLYSFSVSSKKNNKTEISFVIDIKNYELNGTM